MIAGRGPIVGLVLLSHSPALAEGLRDLVVQMSRLPEAVAAAGGTGDGRLGTSPTVLEEAVGRVSGGGGVLVLADIGSAVLTARAWLAGYHGDERVLLGDAPLVEGAVAAGVLASTGASLDDVRAAAQQAWSVRKL